MKVGLQISETAPQIRKLLQQYMIAISLESKLFDHIEQARLEKPFVLYQEESKSIDNKEQARLEMFF